MMFTSLGGSQWPVWAALVGVFGIGLSVLSALFCALRFVLRLNVPRSWIVATGALFVASVVAVGLLVLLTPVLPSTDTVR